MNPNRDNLPVNLPEPLPVEFEPDLHEVDGLLTRALHQAAPAGLSQRVFEMSVESLPHSREEVGAPGHLHLVGADADAERRFVFAPWRRYAMAAAVLLAAGVTLWVTWPRPTPPRDGHVPQIQIASLDLSRLNRLSLPSDADRLESEVAYYFDATDVRSLDDLSSDLRQIVQQLEM